jgi:hypothetical protein
MQRRPAAVHFSAPLGLCERLQTLLQPGTEGEPSHEQPLPSRTSPDHGSRQKVKFCQLIRESHSLEEAAVFGEPPGALSPPNSATCSPVTPLSPKTAEATAGDATTNGATTTFVAPLSPPNLVPRSPAAQLSPKTDEATVSDATTSDRATSDRATTKGADS